MKLKLLLEASRGRKDLLCPQREPDLCPGLWLQVLVCGSRSWFMAPGPDVMLRRHIARLRSGSGGSTGKSPEDAAGAGGAEAASGLCPLHLRVDVVAMAARVQVRVCVMDGDTVRKFCCSELLQAAADGAFVTSVCFHGDHHLHPHSRIRLTVYHTDQLTPHTARNFLGFTSFSIRDLLGSKEPHVSLSLRTMGGVSGVGEVKVSRLQMEGEGDDKTEHKVEKKSDRKP